MRYFAMDNQGKSLCIKEIFCPNMIIISIQYTYYIIIWSWWWSTGERFSTMWYLRGEKEIFSYICPRYGIILEEWNHDSDHIHVMFRAKPVTELSKFINAYKSASSRLLKKEYPEIRSRLWKEFFWSRSFCLLTAGGAPVEVIRAYIESQGEGGKYGKRV